VLPRLPGFERVWGRNIIHCPYCHGWEVSGSRWGVVAYDQPGVAGKVGLFASWADDLVLFADHRTGADAIDHCKRRGVPVEWRRITGLRTRGNALHGVEIEGGEAIALPTLLWPLRQRLPELVLGLGFALDGDGHVAVDEGQRTSLPGVYAAGDIASFRRQQVVHAAAAGVTAASSVVADIAAERWVLSPV